MSRGKVWLVGAGPGDRGLITVKGQKAISQAEVIMFDKLVGQGLLAGLPEEVELIDVGKIAGNHPVPQDEINRLLLEKAMEGKRVVRLKGGDPFLFGRGGEELEQLVEKDIPFEIVPGVTSAISVPAYNGIPVTHRDYCSSVHIITGHGKGSSDPKIPYEALVKTKGTLVFLMGVASLPGICRGLIDGGMDKDMPAAVLEKGTTARQRRLVSTVEGLPEAAVAAEVKTPAIIVVGKVCALADQFHWAEDRPLAGLRIGVTRPRARASALTEKLLDMGAEVIEIPAVKTKPIPETEELLDALKKIDDYGWVAFTSPAGVEVFFDKLRQYKLDIRKLGNVKLAAIGSATAKALELRGLLVDLVPEVYSGEKLGEALAEQALANGEKVLIPRAKIGTDEVLRPLRDKGVDYEDIPIYNTIEVGMGGILSVKDMVEKGELDWVAFTSASTVESFVKAAGGKENGVNALCIGEQTAKAAKKYNMRTIVAEKATIESMAERLAEEVNPWKSKDTEG